MRSRAATRIVTLVLAICLVCPVVDMFDYWDHAPQTGNDTEYTFMILGLCIGALYTFAHAVLRISASARSERAVATDAFLTISSRGPLNFTVQGLISASPPLATLRI
jgi:hypothetical protein